MCYQECDSVFTTKKDEKELKEKEWEEREEMEEGVTGRARKAVAVSSAKQE